MPTRLRAHLLDLVLFCLLLSALAWLLYAGIERMGYRWQWYRVMDYFTLREAGQRVWVVIEDGQFYFGPLIEGLIVTLKISAWSMALTVPIGLLTALAGRSASFVARALARLYVEIIRNTPLLVQLFLVYFVLGPILGLDRFFAVVLALALFEGAYAAEIFRSGIESVPRGQWEAARALGLSPWRIQRHIILPQALRTVLPPTTGLAISLIKHSSIASVVALFDLTNQGRNVIADTFMTFEIWLVVALMYLALTLSLSLLAQWLERHLRLPGQHS